MGGAEGGTGAVPILTAGGCVVGAEDVGGCVLSGCVVVTSGTVVSGMLVVGTVVSGSVVLVVVVVVLLVVVVVPGVQCEMVRTLALLIQCSSPPVHGRCSLPLPFQT